MKKFILLFATLLLTTSTWAHQPSDEVLDAFHKAASEANYERYFSLLADNAVFLGTDAGERWTKAEFAEYVKPHFSRGSGWTYVVESRNYTIIDPTDLVLFDEILTNNTYGRCRGSGVIKKGKSGWQIVQYNLSIPIPNDIANRVVKQIKRHEIEQQ